MKEKVIIIILGIYAFAVSYFLFTSKTYSILNDENSIRDDISWALPGWRGIDVKDALETWNINHPNCKIKDTDNLKDALKRIYYEYQENGPS